MKRERIAVLAQLLSGIKDAIGKLEESQRNKDVELMTEAKEEILYFQREIDKLL